VNLLKPPVQSWAGLNEIGRDQNGVVRIAIDEKYYRPREVHSLLGDFRKAKEKLGWEPKTSFAELVRIMTEADTEAIAKGLIVS
jgi:GDPmannose 4,6-dehydratase